MGDLGLFLVDPSGLETIAASRIYFNCCWSSHFLAYLYNLLIFWRHMCSKRALLLKDWSIPIVFTLYLIRSDCNITLCTTHCCSNVSIKITESTTLVIILDLIHLATWAVLPSFWKHLYYLPTEGNFVVVCKFNKLTDVVAIRCAWWFGIEVVGMLKSHFICVSQDYMSSLFVLFK